VPFLALNTKNKAEAFCYVCASTTFMAKHSPKQPAKAPKKELPKWLFPALIALAFAIVYPYIFNEKVDLGGDNASYYILGKALSSGEGYNNIHVPGNPPHNHFPPGYPAIMAIFMVFTQSINFLKIVNGLFLLGTALLSFKVFTKFTDNPRMAFVGALLLLFNSHLLSYGTIMMSEVPFLFFATLAILLFINLQAGSKPFYKDLNFYGLIVVTSFAYHIRTAGIALVAGFALYMLINKNWKELGGYLAGFVALGIPWFLRGQSLGGSSYLTQLFLINPYRPEEGSMGAADWFTRFGNNLSRYLGKEIPNGIFPSVEVDYTPDADGVIIYGVLIMAFAIFGLVKLPKYRLLLAGYLLGSFGILLLWPDVWFGVRFILPLLPILLFLFLYGIYALLNLAMQKMGLKSSPNPLLFLVFVLVFIPQLKLLAQKAKEPYQDTFQRYFEAAVWSNKNLPDDAIVCTRKPGLFYLFGARKATQFANTPDYDAFFADLDTNGVTHIIIDQLGYAQTGRYLVPAIQDNPEKFQVLNLSPKPETYVLQYNRGLGYTGEWNVEEKDGYYTHTREGQGKVVYADGRIFEGTFKNNLPNGPGTLTYPDGRKETGMWADGNLLTE
jgi:hypothetical protein